MNWLARLYSRIFLAILTTCCGASATLAAPLSPACSWPFEATGGGITNLATPDTNATYWVMPLDTSRWATMVIRGTYPAARFFNFTAYTATGSPISTVVDADVGPDPGSTNPFATPAANGSHDYTVEAGTTAAGSANVLAVTGSRLVFIVYRVYAPDMGLDRTGGTGVPNVSLIGHDGSVRRLQPCPFAAAESSLGNMIILLAANQFADAANFLQKFLAAANQRGLTTGVCNPQAPGPAPVVFGPPVLNSDLFPNPQAKYLETQGFCFQTNKIVVVRGKAPVFPNTYLGGSVFQPAFDTAVQVRYWSMCNNDSVIPYPVVACQADFETKLDGNQFYTYVISDDPAPPVWLPATATWLSWGDTSVPKNLIFRNILAGDAATAEFTPTGVFCDETLFVGQGWQGCFAAAGISVTMQ